MSDRDPPEWLGAKGYEASTERWLAGTQVDPNLSDCSSDNSQAVEYQEDSDFDESGPDTVISSQMSPVIPICPEIKCANPHSPTHRELLHAAQWYLKLKMACGRIHQEDIDFESEGNSLNGDDMELITKEVEADKARRINLGDHAAESLLQAYLLAEQQTHARIEQYLAAYIDYLFENPQAFNGKVASMLKLFLRSALGKDIRNDAEIDKEFDSPEFEDNDDPSGDVIMKELRCYYRQKRSIFESDHPISVVGAVQKLVADW